MWRKEYCQYVLYHFNLYYTGVDNVVISHGLEGSLQVSNTGISCFDSDDSAPSYKMIDGLPVLFAEDDKELIEKTEAGIRVTADIISGIFFLLSGWQERGKTAADDRFYCRDSWQGSNGFERYALVDSYFSILAKAAELYTGNLIKKKLFSGKPVTVFLSHDIDKIFSGRLEGSFNVLKKGDVLKGIKGLLASKDPWFNLDEIAQLEEEAGAKSTYFFLTKKGKVPEGINADYDFNQAEVQAQVEQIRQGNSEVALHGSLGSHRLKTQFNEEWKKLKGTSQAFGNRFHYLKFNINKTVSVLERSGVTYDATMGFPDTIGFRNGTSFPFYLYNFEENRPAHFVSIPLHVMDTTLQHKKYLGLSPDMAGKDLNAIFTETKKWGGVFCLLWHNNYFSDYKFAGWRSVYAKFLAQNKNVVSYTTAHELAKMMREIKEA